ncbi:hypothetical protein TWF281_000164 [Arthrobotrys megalospora]
MKLSNFVTTALLASTAVAHHVITHVLVDNVRQYNVLRQPGTLDPITNPNSPALACGFPPSNGQGMKETDKATVTPGSNITFEWHTNWSASVSGPEGVTDVSHKGPCAIYMRKVPDSITAIAEDPRKPNWFKVWEDGVDKDGIFCTSRMRLNGGFFTGTVPKHLENGDYLIRAETITLNNAAEPHLQPQWYVGCAQVTLKDSEAPFIKPVTIPIPGGNYANMNMPGLRYNIWYPERRSYRDYGPVPGPAVFDDGSDKFEEPEEPNTSTIIRHVTPTSTLPHGFTTIPWPASATSTSEESTQFITTTILVDQPTTSTSTQWITATLPPTSTEETEAFTHVLTRTVTEKVVQTVYVNGAPTPTTTPRTMHSRIPYRHTEIVTSTRLVTVTRTRTVFTGRYLTPTSFKTETVDPTATTAMTSPTGVTATTSAQGYGTIVSGRGYHYRRWRRGHLRSRRF